MHTDQSFSPDPETRIRDALDAVLEALRLARRELAGVRDEPERWRWVSLGLVSALQASLIAALSGYATAQPEHVANPSQPGRAAPVALLLRRAKSAEYLSPPERLQLTGAQARDLEALIVMRNAAVHGLGFRVAGHPVHLVHVAAEVIRWLLKTHPAFDVSRFVLILTLIDLELAAIVPETASDGSSGRDD